MPKAAVKVVGAGGVSGGGGYSTMPCVPTESTVGAIND